MAEVQITQEHVDGLAGKLQQFCDSLPSGEQELMCAMLGRAADAAEQEGGDEVSGFVQGASPLFGQAVRQLAGRAIGSRSGYLACNAPFKFGVAAGFKACNAPFRACNAPFRG